MAGSGASEAGAAGFDPLGLDLQICFALYTASNLTTRLYHPLLKPLGITYLQYIALLALWERAPQSVGELGRRLGLDSGTLTPLFKRMEGAGLVSRKRDPADERRVIIHLTAEGTALRDKALQVPAAVFCQLPPPFSDAVALKGLLDSFIRGLRAANPDADGDG